MKEYRGIVQTSVEPNINFIWLSEDKLFYFSGNGWTELGKSISEEDINKLLLGKVDVETLNNYISSNNSKVNTNTKDISSANSKLSSAEKNIESLKTKIADLEKEVQTLKELVNKPVDK